MFNRNYYAIVNVSDPCFYYLLFIVNRNYYAILKLFIYGICPQLVLLVVYLSTSQQINYINSLFGWYWCHRTLQLQHDLQYY